MRNILFGDVTSGPREMNQNDLHGLVRTAGLIAASSVATWLVGVLPGLELGQHKELVLPLVLFALDAARKWLGTRLPDGQAQLPPPQS